MKFRYADGWSDYYDNLPGGEPRGRSLVPQLFDINRLGDWKNRLSMYPGVQMPMGAEDYPMVESAERMAPQSPACTRVAIRQPRCSAAAIRALVRASRRLSFSRISPPNTPARNRKS